MSQRLLALAAVALCGASVASAQAPGLRPIVAQPTQQQFQQRGVRTVGTASPVPIIVQQQQQAMNAAYNEALLWQLSQPPVIVVNPFPSLPYSDPWQTVNYRTNWISDWAFAQQPGALGNSPNVFYRGNTLNNWNRANRANLGWPIR